MNRKNIKRGSKLDKYCTGSKLINLRFVITDYLFANFNNLDAYLVNLVWTTRNNQNTNVMVMDNELRNLSTESNYVTLCFLTIYFAECKNVNAKKSFNAMKIK